MIHIQRQVLKPKESYQYYIRVAKFTQIKIFYKCKSHKRKILQRLKGTFQ